jgi:hypothetical protein
MRQFSGQGGNQPAPMKTLKKIWVFGFLALTGCAASTGYQPMVSLGLRG